MSSEKQPKRMSAGATIAMCVMIAGIISLTAGMTMALAGGRPWPIVCGLMIGGLFTAMISAMFCDNCRATEEEGRLSDTPPLAGRENNCVDNPELDRC